MPSLQAENPGSLLQIQVKANPDDYSILVVSYEWKILGGDIISRIWLRLAWINDDDGKGTADFQEYAEPNSNNSHSANCRKPGLPTNPAGYHRPCSAAENVSRLITPENSSFQLGNKIWEG